MMISYGCFYKKSSEQIIKGSRVETIENARKEYKEVIEECCIKNNYISVVIFKDKNLLSNASLNNLKVYIHYNSKT